MNKQKWTVGVKRVDKPWGHEEWFGLADGRFCGKAIHVTQGDALSFQYHERKEEVIFLQTGRLIVEIGSGEAAMDSFELEPASTTEITDVVRLEDRYGRQGTSHG